MTPPKKKPKLEELVIVDVSIRPPPSKPTQIVSCSQSSQSHHAVVGPVSPNIAHNIGKRLAETTIMPRIEKVRESKRELKKEKEK